MSVRVWGNIPDEPYERRALRELGERLAVADASFHVLTNFAIGSRRIDLFVIAPGPRSATFYLLELKFAGGKAVEVAPNQPMRLDGRAVREPRCPLDQVVDQYRVIREWLLRNRDAFLSDEAANRFDQVTRWYDIKKLLVFCPTLPPTARIDVSQHLAYLDADRFRGDVIGFDHLANYLCRAEWLSNDMPPLDEAGVLRLVQRLRVAELAMDSLREERDESGQQGPGENTPAPASRRLQQDEPAPLPFLRRRARALLITAAAVLGAIGIAALAYLLPGLHSQQLIAPRDARGYVGRSASVRFTIDDIEICGSSSVCIFAVGETAFSVEVRNATVEDVQFVAGDCVQAGPATVTLSKSGNPQIEINRSQLAQLLKGCN